MSGKGSVPPSGPDGPRGFLFDPNLCTGCAACSLACSTENELGWGRSWRQIVSFNRERRPGLPAFHLSLACNHCAQAPCVAHCPTGAIRRDPRTGAVLVDDARCIGCRYCAWVCPYDAPRFDTEGGTMAKCTLCNHRLLDGLGPACVEACPTDALGFGHPGAAQSDDRILGFPLTDAAPRIAFTPLRRSAAPPASTWHPDGGTPVAWNGTAGAAAPAAPGSNTISFRRELPLLGFTTVAALLVAWASAAALGGAPLSPGLFAVAAAASLLVSTLHLARPWNAWRAVAGVGSSRLSREVVAYGLFLALASVWMAADGILPGTPAAPALGYLTTLAGLAALFLVDRVYDPVRPPVGRPVHPGDALVFGPLVASAILQATSAYLALAALKTVLHLRERAKGAGEAGSGPPRPAGWLVAVALIGLAAPPVLWAASPGSGAGWGVAAATAGALADRVRLYLALSIPTPADAALRDAVRLLSRNLRHPRRLHPTDAGSGC